MYGLGARRMARCSFWCDGRLMDDLFVNTIAQPRRPGHPRRCVERNFRRLAGLRKLPPPASGLPTSQRRAGSWQYFCRSSAEPTEQSRYQGKSVTRSSISLARREICVPGHQAVKPPVASFFLADVPQQYPTRSHTHCSPKPRPRPAAGSSPVGPATTRQPPGAPRCAAPFLRRLAEARVLRRST
jgi:hypothetical protein